jgi:TPR repeat protein
LSLLLALAAVLAGCAPELPRDAAAVESVGMRAAQTRDGESLRTLASWAERAPAALATPAARELGLALAPDPSRAAEAVRWLTRAAEADDAEAAWTLGEAHRRGGLGWSPDAAAARPWLLRAASAEHPAALLALARAARNGDAEPRDPQRAFELLQRASRAGNAQAMYLLAQTYAEGEGTPADPALARHWLEQAAELHHPAAMQDWALALEDGRLGVTRDAAAARDQWREAGEERRNRWR